MYVISPYEVNARVVNLKGLCILLSLIFLATFLLLANNALRAEGTQKMQYQYGEKIKFLDKKQIRLPDFSITFQDERRAKSPVYPRGFLFYDFDLTKGKTHKVISWTSGTGDISPVAFEFEEKKFILEMGISDLVKFLNHGELIVWEEDEFRKREKEFYDHSNKGGNITNR